MFTRLRISEAIQILTELESCAVAESVEKPIPGRTECLDPGATVPGVRPPVMRRQDGRQVAATNRRLREHKGIGAQLVGSIGEPPIAAAEIELDGVVPGRLHRVSKSAGELSHREATADREETGASILRH